MTDIVETYVKQELQKGVAPKLSKEAKERLAQHHKQQRADDRKVCFDQLTLYRDEEMHKIRAAGGGASAVVVEAIQD